MASEYRFRDPTADDSVLVAGTSQSGETIDTVWAVSEGLALEREIEVLSRHYHTANLFLFLGRGIQYPVALEGARRQGHRGDRP